MARAMDEHHGLSKQVYGSTEVLLLERGYLDREHGSRLCFLRTTPALSLGLKWHFRGCTFTCLWMQELLPSDGSSALRLASAQKKGGLTGEE